MDKLDMESANLIRQNIEKASILFPNCVVETENGKEIDYEMLLQEISNNTVNNSKEKYQLSWAGKKDAIVMANAPTTNTLRPIREKSVDFDSTKNIFIEGDNLETLKILQESYLNKIKCIYIDPPYNTGNDFVYDDNFYKKSREELIDSGIIDEEGRILITQLINTDANGRFHSDWLNMMYPRIRLSRNLLSEDGVIFISIDDNEYENLKKVCNEIFGERNFVGTIIWERAFSPKNDAKFLSSSHDYIMVYAKNIESFEIGLLPRTEEANARYKNPDNDPKGPWTPDNMTVKTYSASYDYPITTPSGRVVTPTNGRCWFTSKERMEELIREGRIWFGENGDNTPRIKRYLSDVQQGMTATTIWKYVDVGHNQEGRQEVKKLFDDKGVFDNPKPIRLLERILTLANLQDNDIVLDYFCGSASTAHSVLEFNAINNKSIKYIMVQVEEKCDEQTEAYKNGYKTICDIGEDRIKRACRKIKEDTNVDLDYGFRVYKLDSSNMKDIYYKPNDINQNQIDIFTSNIKEDRTPEDILTQIILDWGLTLDLPIEEKTVNDNKIFFVANNSLVACLDEKINIDIIDEIAKYEPVRVVFRDEAFEKDSDKINAYERLKKLTPNTEIKVI